MSDGVSGGGGWASCDVPGVESGDVFGSVREKRLSAGDGAFLRANCPENWLFAKSMAAGHEPRATHHPN